MKKIYFRKMAKRALRVLPVILLSMAGMLSLFFFCLTAFRLGGRVRVGVTAPKEDKMVSALITYVEHINEISSLCDFLTVEEEEGKKQLEQGEISALIVIPEEILNRIYRNEEVNLRVYLPKTPTMESGLIREFSEACASLVLSAKSGDYTALELYRRYRAAGDRGMVVRDMNSSYIRFVMLQGGLFENRAAPGEDGMSDGIRLQVAGLTCLLFLLGIPAAGLIQRTPKTLELQLRRGGIGSVFQQTVSVLLLTGCLYAAGLVELAAAHIFGSPVRGMAMSVLCLLPVCLFAASFFCFLYSCGRTAGTVPVIFLLAVLFVFLPGGIFPPYMLPQGIVRFGQILPGGAVMRILWKSMWQNRMGMEVLWILVYGLFFFLMGVWARRRGGRRQ